MEIASLSALKISVQKEIGRLINRPRRYLSTLAARCVLPVDYNSSAYVLSSIVTCPAFLSTYACKCISVYTMKELCTYAQHYWRNSCFILQVVTCLL